MRYIKYFIICFFSLIIRNDFLFSQIGIYKFSGDTITVSTQPANAFFSEFIRVNVSELAVSGVFNSKDWNQDTVIDYNEYIEFTIKANPGISLTLTNISFAERKSYTGPQIARIAHNNSGNFSTDTLDFITTDTTSNINWDFADFTTNQGDSVTFRIYAWNSNGGSFRVDNVALYGTINNYAPIGDSLNWGTIFLGANHKILSPVNNTYDLGNICNYDNFLPFKLAVIDSNINKNPVPAIYKNDTIGNFIYDTISSMWTLSVDSLTIFDIGTNNINFTFTDTAIPTISTNFIIKFNTIAPPAINLGNDTIICSANTLTLDAGAGMDSYLWSDNSTVRKFVINSTTFPICTDTIFAIITDNGCQNTDSIIVTMKQTPTVVVLPSSLTVCSKTPVTLVASGATTYTWSSGTVQNTVGDSVIVIPLVTTSYTVTGTFNGCTSTAHSNIIAKSLPNIDLGNDLTITTDQTLVLGATPIYDSYIWSTDSTNTFILIYADSLGIGVYDYWVSVTDSSNGCSIVDSITITVHHGLGISNNQNNSSINIYPNPATDNFNIQLINIVEKQIIIELYNIVGEKVIQENFICNEEQFLKNIKINYLLPGLYILKIINGDIIKTQKLIIE